MANKHTYKRASSIYMSCNTCDLAWSCLFT